MSSDRPIRIYCDGIYDLFHYGHAKSLEQAKKTFPNVYLLVGVCGDEITHEKKGCTVMTAKERAECVRHCKWVDEVIEEAPWIITQDFLDLHSIDFVAHDDAPYPAAGHEDVFKYVKEKGIFIPTARTDGISTSELITRIVKDYEVYLRRNLARGVPANDLNISFFKESELKMKDKVQMWKLNIAKKLKESEANIKENWINTKIEVLEMLRRWEEKSSLWIRRFVAKFDKNQSGQDVFEECEEEIDENSLEFYEEAKEN